MFPGIGGKVQVSWSPTMGKVAKRITFGDLEAVTHVHRPLPMGKLQKLSPLKGFGRGEMFTANGEI